MSDKSISAYQFLYELMKFAPENAKPIYCQFPDPPDVTTDRFRWKGTPVNVESFKRRRQLNGNAYITVSAFFGERRRKAEFCCLLAVMIDDPGTKVDFDKLKMEPTIWLETSPGNFQAWYLLKVPVTDRKQAEGVLKALIDSGLTDDGKDPGMAGVTRYGRVPGGHNNKTALGQEWLVTARWGEGKRRYTIEEICKGFGIIPAEVADGDRAQDIQSSDDATLFAMYCDPVGRYLYDQGYVKNAASGKVDIICPWIDEHTGGQDDGTAIIVNVDGSIGFKCHHGHCQAKGLKEVWAWARENGLVEQVRENDEWENATSSIDLWEQVREALAADDARAAIIKLKRDYPAQRFAIEEYKQYLQDAEADAIATENAEKRAKRKYPQQLDLERVFHGDGGVFARSIIARASLMNSPPEFLAGPLITTLASVMGTRQTIKVSSGWLEYPIFWLLVVAGSGEMKSPGLQVSQKALISLQRKAYQRFEMEKAAFEKEPDAFEAPVLKHYWADDSSAERIIGMHQDNPTGFILRKEEGSAHVTEMGRYSAKQGGNGEREGLLKQFNGAGMKVDRSGGAKGPTSGQLDKSAIQRDGTTQFSTLAKLMGDHADGDGFWSRFLFVATSAGLSWFPAEKLTEEGDPLEVQIENLMIQIENIPSGEYEFTAEARQLASEFHNRLVKAGADTDSDDEKTAYPKFRTYFYRFCLWLHVANTALAGLPVVPTEIQPRTVKLAKHLLSFFMGQFQKVMDMNSPARLKTGALEELERYLKRKGGALTVRDVVTSKCLKKRGISSASDYRKQLDLLVKVGKAIKEGKDVYSLI